MGRNAGVTTETLLDAALNYAEHQIPVFPVWGVTDGRCQCGKRDCANAGKHPHGAFAPNGFKDATTDPERIREWWTRAPRANIGTTTSWCVVLDVDPRKGGDETLARLERELGALPETPEVLTGGGGRHIYFARPTTTLRCSAGALGPGLDIRADGGYVLLPPSSHMSGKTYTDEVSRPLFETPLAPLPVWLLEIATSSSATNGASSSTETTDWSALLAGAPEGQRHAVAARIAGHYLGKRLPAEEVEEILLGYAARCHPPFDATDCRRIVRDLAVKDARLGNATDDDDADDATRSTPPWPQLDPAALTGLAGRIVETIAPRSEADPVAILLHTLVATGNLLGPGPQARVEQDSHPARLNVVLVGKSSKGRKGTGWSSPKAMLRSVDPHWAIASGLSSGEGLIYHVRDRVTRTDPESGETEILDEGIVDKRLLVMETEFATVLARMARDGNTLSAVLRDAWDHGDLRTLTKNSPLRATGAHVSILGHITQEELARLFTDVSMANGFGNRFLWACVRRARLLPDGGGLEAGQLSVLAEELRGVVTTAGRIGRMTRDPEAAAAWHALYADLSRERDGLVGALLGRAEAQTLRLSVLYAVLDRSPVIRLPHLQAALAVWAYAEASVLHLFGGRLGHPIADAILDALRRAGRLTRTEIRDLFGRHKDADQIEDALGMLQRSRLAQPGKRQTGGRPEQYWEPWTT